MLFPYFQHTTGIVSVATLSPGPREATLELEPGGHVSSHLVKYSHHPDGTVLFSQTGRVLSRVRKSGMPLAEVDGHLFTVHVHGLQQFGIPRPKDETARTPNPERTRLSFRFTDEEPASLKFVGSLHPLQNLGRMIPNGVVSPRMNTVDPSGKVGFAFVCSSPEGTPGESRVLLISCEALPVLDRGRNASLLFLGGFDPVDVVNDLTKPTSVLAFSYPVENADELRLRLGSVDFTPRSS